MIDDTTHQVFTTILLFVLAIAAWLLPTLIAWRSGLPLFWMVILNLTVGLLPPVWAGLVYWSIWRSVHRHRDSIVALANPREREQIKRKSRGRRFVFHGKLLR